MRPNKITREQYRAAYRLGVKKHKGEVTITGALRDLQATGLNKSSAADLIYITTYLISGRRYTRRLSVAAANDYLKWILRDFKVEGLRRAVSALDQHIRYYEKLSKTRLHSDRERLAKYRHLLGQSVIPTDQSRFEVEWITPGSKGWADLLPLDWFQKRGTTKNRTHDVRTLSGRRVAKARCDVTVSEGVAELNYEAHFKFNEAEGMDIGVALIHFSDTDHTLMGALEWRAAGESKFNPFPFRLVRLQIPDEKDYQLPTDKAPRKAVLVRERPGQAIFRRKLKGAYSHTCCMTGCDAPDALEGAHIDRFVSTASDNLRNGLLLRRDVHALFDRHLISIDPATKVIHVAESIRTATAYAFLHEKALRLPSNPTHQPSSPALMRHWKRFISVTM